MIEGLVRLTLGVIVWGLIGLFIAWLIKVIGKRERLPRWPIYACLAFFVVSTIIAAFVLASAIQGDLANSN